MRKQAIDKRKATAAAAKAGAEAGERHSISISGDPDILEWQLPPSVLDILLKDRSRDDGGNIIWATDDYVDMLGDAAGFKSQIKADDISNPDKPIIRPRTVKSAEVQRQRSVSRAEVFTPTWVCNRQINLVDAAWFGREKSPFSIETSDKKGNHSWRTTIGKPIKTFPKGRTWIDYVKAPRLEIACGEGPYVTSRYDAVSGSRIDVNDRIGILDRKLRLVTENVGTHLDVWWDMAKHAVKSVYAFDYQGDNVLLARENILWTVVETCCADFGTNEFSVKAMEELAEIISWNVWQMDALKYVSPESCEPKSEGSLPGFDAKMVPCRGCREKKFFGAAGEFLHTGRPCLVKNWTTGDIYPFYETARRRK